MRLPPLVLATVALLVLAACSGEPKESDSARAGPVLTDLENVDQLRALFNEREGVPRLILLFSPT